MVVVANAVNKPAGEPLDWTRLSTKSPCLRRAITVHRHRYRSQRWYLLRDPATGQWQRLNASAYGLVKQLDGRHDLNTAQQAAELDDAEAMAVIDALNRADMLDWGVSADADAMHDRADQGVNRKRLHQVLTPFSIRIPLLDPDRFLDHYLPLARASFSLAGFGVFVLLLGLATTLAVDDWDAISGYWSARGFTRYSLFLIPIVYVCMKIAHELAHGLAAKRWGAEVRDMGIVLLLLIPIPYVDTSAAWAFPQKRRRLVVGAAGIAAELGLAALATIVFVLVEPGVIKDFAYTVMLLGSVSTLVFNGNPLLRFDGYYVLADAIEIPNLSPRATRYWIYLAQRYVCGLTDARSPVSARGERGWFFGYGAASTVYRLGVMVAIALFVAAELPLVGMALAITVLTLQLAMPLGRQLRFIVASPRLAGHRRRALSCAAVGILALVIGLLAVPAPLSTYAEGVVWLPEHARIRAGTDGTIATLFADNAAAVEPGAILARIDNPLLDARVRALEWELQETELRRDVARVDDRVDAQVLRDTVRRLRADLVELRDEAAGLEVTIPVGGRLVIPKSHHLEGRYVHKGDVIAYVLESPNPTVRVVVPQRDIGLLRSGVRATKVRLAEEGGTTLNAAVLRETPSATRELPSPALGTLGGGLIAVDPADASGTAAIDGLFVVDLALDNVPISQRVGGRVHVRFEHPAEPLGFRLYRAVRQLLLSRLAV